MLSRYFTSARRLLPCAAISTFFPARMSGAIALCQYGMNRATVSLRDSVRGSSFGERQAATGARFLASLVVEVDVGPPGEPVLLVPGAFAVANQNESIHAYADLEASCRMAARPAYFACAPSSSSIRSSWLYFAMR